MSTDDLLVPTDPTTFCNTVRDNVSVWKRVRDNDLVRYVDADHNTRAAFFPKNYFVAGRFIK